METLQRHKWQLLTVGVAVFAGGLAVFYFLNTKLGWVLIVLGAVLLGAVRVATFTDANRVWAGRKRGKRTNERELSAPGLSLLQESAIRGREP